MSFGRLSAKMVFGDLRMKSIIIINSLALISSQTKDYISKRSLVNATFVNGKEYYQGFNIASMPGIDN